MDFLGFQWDFQVTFCPSLLGQGLKGSMPTSKRKGIPGKCSLPKTYVHPTHSMFMGGFGHGAMGMPFMGMPQQMSLGQLGGGAGPLAITYPESNTGSAMSVKSALDQLFSGA